MKICKPVVLESHYTERVLQSQIEVLNSQLKIAFGLNLPSAEVKVHRRFKHILMFLLSKQQFDYKFIKYDIFDWCIFKVHVQHFDYSVQDFKLLHFQDSEDSEGSQNSVKTEIQKGQELDYKVTIELSSRSKETIEQKIQKFKEVLDTDFKHQNISFTQTQSSKGCKFITIIEFEISYDNLLALESFNI